MFGLNIPLAYKLDSRGLKKAEHQVSHFKETLKRGLELGGIGLGASEIVNIARESVKAAQGEILSQRQLDMVLERSTKQHGKNNKSVEKYITAASRATGVVRAKLRPAFSILARTTNDTTKASGLLNKAMDISAATGKPLETVVRAVAKAYAGNDKTLRRLLPGIKDNQNAMKYATKTFKDSRLTLADPFARLSNVVDMAKEKLGTVLLPIVQKVVGEITKPGGLADMVGKFFEDVSNPKTDIGKSFVDLQNSIGAVGDTVNSFFKQFDPKGNSGIVGFTTLVGQLGGMLPTFIALKGFFMAFKFVKGTYLGAVALINSLTTLLGVSTVSILGALSEVFLVLSLGGSSKLQTVEEAKKATTDIANSLKRVQSTQNGAMVRPLNSTTNNNHVSVHVTTNDPQKVIDAITQWSKKNGPLPAKVTGVK